MDPILARTRLLPAALFFETRPEILGSSTGARRSSLPPPATPGAGAYSPAQLLCLLPALLSLSARHGDPDPHTGLSARPRSPAAVPPKNEGRRPRGPLRLPGGRGPGRGHPAPRRRGGLRARPPRLPPRPLGRLRRPRSTAGATSPEENAALPCLRYSGGTVQI